MKSRRSKGPGQQAIGKKSASGKMGGRSKPVTAKTTVRQQRGGKKRHH